MDGLKGERDGAGEALHQGASGVIAVSYRKLIRSTFKEVLGVREYRVTLERSKPVGLHKWVVGCGRRSAGGWVEDGEITFAWP